MTSFHRVFGILVAVLLVSGAVVRPAGAAMMPVAFSDLVGSWSCTYTGPKGTSKSTYTISRVGDLVLSGTGESGAYGSSPANKSAFMFAYDPKKRLFVSLGGDTNPGDYGASTASAPAGAMTLTFTNAWPADPTHERDVWHFAPTSLTIASSWTEKGKATSSKTTCTKE